MKALTLWRPWPWAIFHGGVWAKRIENRPWKPWPSIIGKPIALHAGKAFDKSAVDEILDKTAVYGVPRVLPACATDEGLIGLATVTGYVTTCEDAAIKAEQGQERWFVGPYAWVLTNVRTFAEPIRIKGKQGLWDLPTWANVAVANAVLRMPLEPSVERGPF